MNTLDILKAARKTIANPKHWTKGANARDDKGESIRSVDKKAVCWCAFGAILKHDTNNGLVLNRLNRATKFGDFVAFNDAAFTTHADVLALFDDAIAAEQTA